MSNECEIEFRSTLCLVREMPDGERARLLNVPKGTRMWVRLRGHHKGARESADVYLPDGSLARDISYALFHFVPTAQEYLREDSEAA